ncbi:hypothetical protein EVAR_619_1 [Eumeta japonica]|uniref:Uncharacterized protein n=1 Tax=Eumeta variegata TaxID=151549 RepID=A0A4C1SE75_EUMVA|nr:hypothetical protein EVAR_619_1 [Eumeta japonica]
MYALLYLGNPSEGRSRDIDIGGPHDGRLTPGSGPQRTLRRGAAGSDANSPRLPHLPECDKPPATMLSRSRPTPTGTNTGRPACVCAAEHARRVPRYAPRPGPACYFVTTLN